MLRICEDVIRRHSRESRGPWFRCGPNTVLRAEEDSDPSTVDFRTSCSAIATQGHKGSLNSNNRTVCHHQQQQSCPSAPGQYHQNPQTPLQSAHCTNLDCRNRALGLVGYAEACGVSPRPLAEPDLPVRPLSLHCQGTSECFFSLRTVRADQFGGGSEKQEEIVFS